MRSWGRDLMFVLLDGIKLSRLRSLASRRAPPGVTGDWRRGEARRIYRFLSALRLPCAGTAALNTANALGIVSYPASTAFGGRRLTPAPPPFSLWPLRIRLHPLATAWWSSHPWPRSAIAPSREIIGTGASMASEMCCPRPSAVSKSRSFRSSSSLPPHLSAACSILPPSLPSPLSPPPPPRAETLRPVGRALGGAVLAAGSAYATYKLAVRRAGRLS